MVKDRMHYPVQLLAETSLTAIRLGVVLLLYSYVYALNGGVIKDTTFQIAAWSMLLYFILMSVGVRHFSNEGVCSWYDFAKTIFELSAISCRVKPIETKDYPTPATRPHYSLLNKAKIKNTFDLTIPYWKDSLIDCLENLTGNNTF